MGKLEGSMIVRKLAGALAALGVFSMAVGAPAWASAPTSSSSEDSAAANAPRLANAILTQLTGIMPTCGKDASLAAISSATNGADLATISAALRLLRSGGIDAIVGPDPAAQTHARNVLACNGVQDALAESSEVARLAQAAGGATGGVPTGGAPGQAFGPTGAGAPGGGGGSGYVVISH
jgi:hypothetical protein